MSVLMHLTKHVGMFHISFKHCGNVNFSGTVCGRQKTWCRIKHGNPVILILVMFVYLHVNLQELRQEINFHLGYQDRSFKNV